MYFDPANRNELLQVAAMIRYTAAETESKLTSSRARLEGDWEYKPNCGPAIHAYQNFLHEWALHQRMLLDSMAGVANLMDRVAQDLDPPPDLGLAALR